MTLLANRLGLIKPSPTMAVTARAAELGLLLLSCGVYANTIRVLVPITVEDTAFAEGMKLLVQAIRDTV